MNDQRNRADELKIAEVPFEESVMGKIQRELEGQAEKIAENGRQEDRHRAEQDTKADVDRRKNFRNSIIVAIISAAATAFFANLERIGKAVADIIRRLF